MPRRHRHFPEQSYSLEQTRHHRERVKVERTRILDYEEYHKRMNRIIDEIRRIAVESRGYTVTQLEEVEMRLAKDEEKVMKEMEEYFFTQKYDIVHHFFIGFRMGLRGYTAMFTHALLSRAYAEAVIRLRYKTAWKWRGFIVQVFYDRLYNTIVQDKPQALQAIFDAVKLANRHVELVEGMEEDIISMAHEYLSFLRKRRCHISAMLIKVTPVTLRLLEDKRGNLYTAIHMSGKEIMYNPYVRATMPRVAWLSVVNKRKGHVERFSIKLFGTTDIIQLQTELVTARDYKDDAYLSRTLADIVLRPYVVMKDRARGMGFPEKRFDVEHCSVYAIPIRKTRTAKINKRPTSMRLFDKKNIYLRRRIL